MQLEGTSNIINVGLSKDKEIDDILNNKLAPINEEDGLELGQTQPKVQEPQPQTKVQESQPSFQKSGGAEASITSTDIMGELETTTVTVGTNKTSLLESPMPLRNNKINDIIPTVRKGRPPKNKNADKFFNNLI
jgi:hypothetical protein